MISDCHGRLERPRQGQLSGAWPVTVSCCGCQSRPNGIRAATIRAGVAFGIVQVVQRKYIGLVVLVGACAKADAPAPAPAPVASEPAYPVITADAVCDRFLAEFDACAQQQDSEFHRTSQQKHRQRTIDGLQELEDDPKLLHEVCEGQLVFTARITSFLGCRYTAPSGEPLVFEPASFEAPIGVAECDAYVTEYSACVESKAPEATKARLRAAIGMTREGWRAVAEGPGRDQLVSVCNAALDAVGRTSAAWGCAIGTASPARSTGKIGIPACDKYVEEYRRCIDNRAPDNTKQLLHDALDETVEGWREVAAGPGADALAGVCEEARKAVAEVAEAWNCQFEGY